MIRRRAAVSASRERSAEAERPYRTEKEWRRLERENLMAVLKASGGKVSATTAPRRCWDSTPTLDTRLRALGLKKTFDLSSTSGAIRRAGLAHASCLGHPGKNVSTVSAVTLSPCVTGLRERHDAVRVDHDADG